MKKKKIDKAWSIVDEYHGNENNIIFKSESLKKLFRLPKRLNKPFFPNKHTNTGKKP
tara:strand:- start:471 stop:641 length:171 start_codon:yes stop_codon:yes gene_type:complete